MARDFEWHDTLWAVIKEDGSFAGVPCTSFGEARELANQHKGSHIYCLSIDYDDDIERYPENYDLDTEDECDFYPDEDIFF